MRLMARIGRNFGDVKLWGRNAKVLVITETLWGIPMSWLFFYQAIFMRSLGMSDVFIGFTAMLPFVFQIFLPMLGGYLADKFGRKRILMLFDSVGWTGALLIWFMAREPWQIIAAMIFQGLSTAIYGVWETLLVEDTELAYRVSIYSFVQIIYVFGGILTPVAGALVSLYGVEQGCRYMFFITLMTVTTTLVIRQICLRESKIGRMLLSSEGDSLLGSEGYGGTLRTVTKHKKLLTLFALTIIGSIEYPLVNTFKPLYLVDPNALALDESIVSIIPMVSSIPSLVALSFLVPRLKYERMKKALTFSYACGFFGLTTLILAPKGSMILATFSAVLDSARFIATFSILRVFFANMIDEVNPFARAKVMSLIVTFSALVSWPVPLVGGYLYEASPILPFVLGAIFLVLSVCLTLKT